MGFSIPQVSYLQLFDMGRIFEILFFIYLGYLILKNVLGIFVSKPRPQDPYQQAYEQSRRKEGEIHVDHVPEKQKPSTPHAPHSSEDSEYIPFDEVKE